MKLPAFGQTKRRFGRDRARGCLKPTQKPELQDGKNGGRIVQAELSAQATTQRSSGLLEKAKTRHPV
jgi:hypothetical protein